MPIIRKKKKYPVDVHLCTSVYILNVDLCEFEEINKPLGLHISQEYIVQFAMFDRNETIIKQEGFLK